jgi:hypothetical protein
MLNRKLIEQENHCNNLGCVYGYKALNSAAHHKPRRSAACSREDRQTEHDITSQGKGHFTEFPNDLHKVFILAKAVEICVYGA